MLERQATDSSLPRPGCSSEIDSQQKKAAEASQKPEAPRPGPLRALEWFRPGHLFGHSGAPRILRPGRLLRHPEGPTSASPLARSRRNRLDSRDTFAKSRVVFFAPLQILESIQRHLRKISSRFFCTVPKSRMTQVENCQILDPFRGHAATPRIVSPYLCYLFGVCPFICWRPPMEQC
ncbi:unnamed protein product [Amoebophrya sp. A120]|nr:unnamed protein product [Amoebophrya sp. A120]|eukprot:GSA120T00017573001.1